MRSLIKSCPWALILGGVLSGCGRDSDTSNQSKDHGEPEGPSAFWETYTPDGIDFVHFCGDPNDRLLPQSLGAGCVIADFDQDNDNDIYFLQGNDLTNTQATPPSNALYWNNGDGTFTLAGAKSGVQHFGFGISGSVADVDQDGDLDLYLCNLGPNALLLNNGDATFQTAENAGGAQDDGFSTGSTFFDADRDGDLDLYVTRYVDWSLDIEADCVNLLGGSDFCPPGRYNRPLGDKFFRNDGGTFVEETRMAGFSGPVGHGLACTAGDIDGDGWDDIYVANDQTPNFLWINNKDGTFSERAVQFGCATSNTGKARAGMSATMIDIDGDLDFDIHVSNLEGESDGLFVNQDGQFLDQSAAKALAGSSRKMTRWGAVFGDWDLDGQLEMFTACGKVLQTSQSDSTDPYAERDMFHEIAGSSDRFEPRTINHRATNGRAALTSDLNGDLFPELIVTTAWSKPMFMRRRSPEWEDKDFTLIRVLDNGLPAVGALVDIHTKQGSVIRHRIRRDGGYAADTPPCALCPNPADIVKLEIRWPNGDKKLISGPLQPGRHLINKEHPLD